MTDPSPFGGQQPPARPMFNAPKIVLWTIGATLLVFLFVQFGPAPWVHELLQYLVFNPADLAYFDAYPITIGIRWIGYALMHGGWMHVLINCAFLLAFGTPIARQVPVGTFLALYALGAVGGALAVMLIYEGQELYLVGASGAVSALVGALSRMVFLRRGREFVPHPFSDRRSGTIFIAAFFGINLIFSFLPGPGGMSVSGESHIGGFVTGFLMSLVLPWHKSHAKGRAAND